MLESVNTDDIMESSEPVVDSYDFDDGFQRKIVALTLRDTVFAQRTEGLIEPGYMIKDIDGVLVSIAKSYFETYKTTPHITILPMLIKDAIAQKKIRSDMVPDLKVRLREILKTDLGDAEFVSNKVAVFAKHRAVERAILASVDALEKGDFDKITKLMNEANNVGINEVAKSYDYFEEIDNRTQHRRDMAAGVLKPTGITTGYTELDKYLYHNGWGRKELSCVMGPAKSGKSAFMGDFGKNASLAGFNVIYVTLEVSTQIISDRLDANIADIAMKILKDSPFEIQNKITAAKAKAGRFILEEFPSGTLTPKQLRRLIEKHRRNGIIFDLIIVDYADIMCPDRYSNEPREDSRLTWLALRALATEQNAAVLTATQTNREGAKAVISKATDVAEDFNKVRTVDLMFSINALEEEIKAGEARLFFAATRNGEGNFTLRVKQSRDKMQFLTKILGRE